MFALSKRYIPLVLAGLTFMGASAQASDPYADSVASATIDNVGCGGTCQNGNSPEVALEAPDNVKISLGTNGSITLNFDDNVCGVDNDQNTPDITIYEIGATSGTQTEPTFIYVGTQGQPLVGPVVAPGGPSDVDLSVLGISSFNQIRIVDDNNVDGTNIFVFNGADIDAVECLADAATPTVPAINIKPGSDPNSINLCSGGTTPVTIFGSEDLDVESIDVTTLILASAQVKTVGKSDRVLCSIDDVGSFDTEAFDNLGAPDGIPDLTCHFVTLELTDLNDDSEGAQLSGVGCDSVDPFPLCDDSDPTKFEFVGEDSVNIVKDCN